MKLYKILKSNSNIEEGKLYSFINPYSYLLLRHSKLLDDINAVFIDGGFLALIMSLVFRQRIQRISFDMTSLAPQVFKNAEMTGDSIYFVGSKDEEIVNFISRIKEAYPKLIIAGYRNGYFEADEYEKELESICLAEPKIIVVGMGTPIQEKFLIDCRNKGWLGTGFTCGGFFHQTAKSILYYPLWIDKYNLRWMYRIYDEPKLLRRYMIDYTWFLFVFAYDVVKYRISNKGD